MLTLIRKINVGGALTFVGGVGIVAYGTLSGLSPGAIILLLVIANIVAFILAQWWLAWRNLRPLPVAKAPSEPGEPATGEQGASEPQTINLGTNVVLFSDAARKAKAKAFMQNEWPLEHYHFYATSAWGVQPQFYVCGSVQIGVVPGDDPYLVMVDFLLALLAERGAPNITADQLLIRSMTKL